MAVDSYSDSVLVTVDSYSDSDSVLVTVDSYSDSFCDSDLVTFTVRVTMF